jgi:hypothetical protein
MPLTCQETHTAYPTLLRQSFGIYVLEFRDPDNIQLELTAPYR